MLLHDLRAAFVAELRALSRGGERPADPPGEREPLHWPVGALLAVLALALYLLIGAGVAGGRYLDAYNLAFDFDPQRYVLLWAEDEAAWEAEIARACAVLSEQGIGEATAADVVYGDWQELMGTEADLVAAVDECLAG